jgi:hypothetical protein
MNGQTLILLLITGAGVHNRLQSQFYQPPTIFVMYQGESEVYIGGIFQSIGGVRASNVARWTADPPRLAAVGSGVPFVVEKMAVDASGRLIAAGFYTDDYRRAMARWNGTEWVSIALPDSLKALLGITVDPWGYICILSSIRDSVERPVLWRSNGGEWACQSMPTQSAVPVQSVVQNGSVVTFAQGGSIWQFDRGRFTMIDGPDPRSGRGQGLIGHTFARGYLYSFNDTLFAIGSTGLHRWTGENWSLVSPLPSMGGSFVRIEAMATSTARLIVSRSYFHHEIDIGWHVRRLHRWSGGKWSFSTYPYHCTSMAIMKEYLLTGHVSDEVQPMISVRKISDIPWVEEK